MWVETFGIGQDSTLTGFSLLFALSLRLDALTVHLSSIDTILLLRSVCRNGDGTFDWQPVDWHKQIKHLL
jgi:hypothetical protein